MSEEIKDNPEVAPEPVEIPDKFKEEDGSLNQDALLKSYSEAEKSRSQVVTEVDNLKKELEQAKSASEQTALLETLVENTAPKEEKVEQSYDDYLKAQAEEMGLEPDDPAVKLNSISGKAYNSWLKQETSALEEKYDAKLDKIRAEFAEDKASRVKSSDVYKAHEAEIGEMVEAGIDEGKAIQFVLKKAESTSDTSTPPPSTPDGRITGAKVESAYWSNAEERQKMVAMHGEEEVAEMEKTGEARMSASKEVA